jgi:hypothetical protein
MMDFRIDRLIDSMRCYGKEDGKMSSQGRFETIKDGILSFVAHGRGCHFYIVHVKDFEVGFSRRGSREVNI